MRGGNEPRRACVVRISARGTADTKCCDGKCKQYGVPTAAQDVRSGRSVDDGATRSGISAIMATTSHARGGGQCGPAHDRMSRFSVPTVPGESRAGIRN